MTTQETAPLTAPEARLFLIENSPLTEGNIDYLFRELEITPNNVELMKNLSSAHWNVTKIVARIRELA